jgi:single-stranded DNA-binding protein
MGIQQLTVSGFCSLEPKVVQFERNGEQRSLVKIGVGVPVGFGDNKTYNFYELVAFEGDPNFKFISEYVSKGDNVVAVGELRTPRIYDSNGTPKVALEVHIKTFDRPSKGQREESGDGNEQGATATAGGAAPQQQAPQGQGQQRSGGGAYQQRPPQGGQQPQRGAAPQGGQARGQAPAGPQRTGGNYQGNRTQSRQTAPQGGQPRGAAPQPGGPSTEDGPF